MHLEARVAVYYAPRPDDPLFVQGTTWLGRNPENGAVVTQPDVAGIAEVTAEPRVYGFHATLKPPMRLHPGRRWEDVVLAARALAERIVPFDLPALSVQDLAGFVALRECVASAPLQALADACVEYLDPFRAPSSDAELARRRRADLTPRQDEMLLRWGYPYVFDDWVFHMTLTRKLSAAEKLVLMPTAEAHFTAATRVPRRVNDICLFVQPAPRTQFIMKQRLLLRG
jgi:putative phosphonate metabolism protein